MRRLARLLSLLAALSALPAAGEEVVLGLSQNEVAITATFDGSSILVFGAVKRERPIPPGRPLDVILTATGPPLVVEVRRKERRFGIWMNTESVRLNRVPGFYAVASTGPLDTVLSATENLRYRVTLDHVIRDVGAASATGDVAAYTDALVRLRSRDDLFQVIEHGVAVDQQTLFRAALDLPANLIEGDYRLRILLAREGRVVDVYETVIDVRKVGLERWLFTLSRTTPVAYGLLALALAVSAGWGASALFRLLQR